MKVKRMLAVLSMLVVVILAAGCNKEATTQATPDEQIPVVARAGNRVVAEGVVEPARWSDLSFKIGGEVDQAGMQNGDRVAAGDLLARLDTSEMELALKSAEQDLVAQQAALDQLLRGASDKAIARTDKELADQVAQAEIALRAVELQLEKARLEDPAIDVAAAEARIKQLEAQVAQVRANDPSSQVASAQVGLERAKIALDDTQDEYNKALDRPWEDQEIRDAWAKQLEQRQLDYRLAQAQLDGAQKAQWAHTLSLNGLEAQIEEAETQLERAQIAQEMYPVTLDTLAADVDAARANLEALRSTDNPLRDEPLEEQIAQAEVGVRKAEIAVAQIEEQMEDAELRAPFAGIAADIDSEVGDQVDPGQVVAVLATLDQLQVRTTDLTELDVGRISVGNAAEVSVDALPDVKFDGVVSEIGLQGEDYRGDVVYEVIVEFTDTDLPESLRWGMTAMVEIETD
jgi:HlyD family secretion protein